MSMSGKITQMATRPTTVNHARYSRAYHVTAWAGHSMRARRQNDIGAVYTIYGVLNPASRLPGWGLKG